LKPIEPEIVFPEDEDKKRQRSQKITYFGLMSKIFFAAFLIEVFKRGCLFWIVLFLLILVMIFM
jgi:hypothetical protein